MTKLTLRWSAAALVAAAMWPLTASAEFPDKPIRALVTVVPGGATDITARLISDHMSRTLKQPIVVENQGGGGGTIALGTVARAPADGYTIVFMTPAHVSSPALYKKLPYDPETAFAPVSQLTTYYNLLVASSNFPPKTLAEFMTYAKTNTVSVGGGNVGGQSWIMMQKLKTMAGLKLEYIPYKGTGPAISDAMGGNLSTVLTDPASLRGMISDGKLHAIASTAPKRTTAFPNVPSFAEAIPGYEQQGWVGLLAPAGTPKDVVHKLQSAVALAVADPVIRQRLVDGDFGIVGSTPEEFAALLKKEFASYGELIRSTGLTLDDPK